MKPIYLVYGVKLVKEPRVEGDWIGFEPHAILCAFTTLEQAELFSQRTCEHIIETRVFDSGVNAYRILGEEQRQLSEEMKQKKENKS